jgi:hypothetical protein
MKRSATLSQLNEKRTYTELNQKISLLTGYMPTGVNKDGEIHFWHWDMPKYGVGIDFFPKGVRKLYRTAHPKIIVYYDTKMKEMAERVIDYLRQVSGAKHVRHD